VAPFNPFTFIEVWHFQRLLGIGILGVVPNSIPTPENLNRAVPDALVAGE
jgi:hypothetical protein